jgi:hypothetical protein
LLVLIVTWDGHSITGNDVSTVAELADTNCNVEFGGLGWLPNVPALNAN